MCGHWFIVITEEWPRVWALVHRDYGGMASCVGVGSS